MSRLTFPARRLLEQCDVELYEPSIDQDRQRADPVRDRAAVLCVQYPAREIESRTLPRPPRACGQSVCGTLESVGRHARSGVFRLRARPGIAAPATFRYVHQHTVEQGGKRLAAPGVLPVA